MRDQELAQGLQEFYDALVALRAALADYPEVRDKILEGATDWDSLLRFKLLPRF
ncbi:MAG: hypothetical protein RLZZ303_454, partial [Candidatus Hydrogenedentota bacterium]